MFRTINRYTVLALAAGFFTVACSDDDVTPEQQLPTTYNFENVDYSGQLARIQMLDKLEKEAKKANDGTTHVTAATLTSIFENSNGDFNTTKNIKEKTHTDAVDAIYAYFGEIDNLSATPLANRQDGYLVNAEGVEPAQMIAKGLMAAHQYWQAVGTEGYLGQAKMNVDNTEVTPGQGTKMQHHWDEAFGYFGAPKDFPTNEGKNADAPADQKAWFWAKYANSRAAQVDVRQDIMNAFIKGRAAIGNKDLVARDEAIATIREKWELLAAANVVHYINDARKELGKAATEKKDGVYYHNWSEAKAFAGAFKYNPASKFTAAQLTQLQSLLGASPKATTEAKLEEAAALLQQVFKFSDTQMQNL